MRKYTRNLQKKEDQKTKLMQIVRQHLDRYDIKVVRWLPYSKEEQVIYEACMETNRVWIPKPVDVYSFYICMHEIGHIVTGPRRYAHLQEINAEQYAIRKLKQYGLKHRDIIPEAKEYVIRSVCEDIIWRGLKPENVHTRVKRWVKMTPKKFRARAIEVVTNIIEAPADSTEHFRIF